MATAGIIGMGTAAAVLSDIRALNSRSIYNVLTRIGAPEDISNVLQYVSGDFLAGFSSLPCATGLWVVRNIFTMGVKQYIRERVLTYRLWPWLCKICRRTYDSLLHINLKEDGNRALLKIVLINFIILGVISMMWVFGIGVLVFYSIGLFFLLRKYLRKIQGQYAASSGSHQ